MRLYFIRHGHAEDAQGPEFDDFSRRLTPKGIETTRILAKLLQGVGVTPARLFSSPRVRARQTADLLAKELRVVVSVREEVNFGFDVAVVESLIKDQAEDSDNVFVGHEPDLSVTVAQLIGGGEIVMKKGGIARVDLISREPMRGALLWLIAPRILDTLD
jgi:phosphohistidine phosphatase